MMPPKPAAPSPADNGTSPTVTAPPATAPGPPQIAAAPVAPVDQAPLAGAPPPAAASPGPSGPLALAASNAGSSVSLPFADGTAAAAFQRGADTFVVFDERRPIDLSALHDDPVFGTAQVQVLPAATVLRMTLPAGTTLRLARQSGGWTLTTPRAEQAPPLRPLGGQIVDGQLLIPADAPGSVVSVPDADTGGVLLVGTQHDPGQGVAVTRRTPAFAVLASLQGVAIEPVSDAIALHVAAAPLGPGFVLTAEDGRVLPLDPLDAGSMAAVEAARLTRRWNFPNLPVEALQRHLQALTDEAAAAPPQSRGSRRLDAVQAQLALGLDSEAQALATVAATEDARVAEAPDAAALGAVAALLAGRLSESAAIDDPRIGGTDEVALWRAVRAALRGQVGGDQPAPEAAAVFAATLPLVLAYPPPLRDRLLPLVVETMALGGERDAATRLLDARKDDASLDYARALLDEAQGHSGPALATLDRLSQSPDRLLRARASVRAVELRLMLRRLTTAQAADALDKLIYAWRGDARELALRLRVASLRVGSGNWRAALALLRETGGELSDLWPDQRTAIRARMAETFAEALAQDARAALPPLELVSLVEENPDLLPDGEPGRALASRLVDRLAALDLPERAVPVLDKLMAATPPGAARAEVGGRLAAMKLAQGDAQGALVTLSDSTATDLPPPLIESRTITFARATAARGGLDAAVATLASLDTPASDEARADLLEAAKDWPAAASALASFGGPHGAIDGDAGRGTDPHIVAPCVRRRAGRQRDVAGATARRSGAAHAAGQACGDVRVADRKPGAERRRPAARGRRGQCSAHVAGCAAWHDRIGQAALTRVLVAAGRTCEKLPTRGVFSLA